MANSLQQGMTLIELIVVLAIVGILLGVGVPSFIEASKNSKLSAHHNLLVTSLLLARSEAVNNGTPVSVCARTSDFECGDDWSNGWIVFIDGSTRAKIDSSDTILSIQSPISDSQHITALASIDGAAASASYRHSISYFFTGSSNWKNGSFVICDDRNESHARVVNIVLTGDIRRGRKTATSDVPQNAFGLPASCSVA